MRSRGKGRGERLMAAAQEHFGFPDAPAGSLARRHRQAAVARSRRRRALTAHLVSGDR